MVHWLTRICVNYVSRSVFLRERDRRLHAPAVVAPVTPALIHRALQHGRPLITSQWLTSLLCYYHQSGPCLCIRSADPASLFPLPTVQKLTPPLLFLPLCQRGANQLLKRTPHSLPRDPRWPLITKGHMRGVFMFSAASVPTHASQPTRQTLFPSY